jgi:hypothetical protein
VILMCVEMSHAAAGHGRGGQPAQVPRVDKRRTMGAQHFIWRRVKGLSDVDAGSWGSWVSPPCVLAFLCSLLERAETRTEQAGNRLQHILCATLQGGADRNGQEGDDGRESTCESRTTVSYLFMASHAFLA